MGTKFTASIIFFTCAQVLLASPFDSAAISTNEVYKYVAIPNDFRGCIVSPSATNLLVECKMHSSEEMQLGVYMAYEYLRTMSRKGHKTKKLNHDQRISLSPEGWDEFPFFPPADVEFNGHCCSEYDLIMIPFIVRNKDKATGLHEIVCKFFYGNEFAFALYVNLNVTSISPEFLEDSHCPIMLRYIARFPYLSEREVQKQTTVIETINRNNRR